MKKYQEHLITVRILTDRELGISSMQDISDTIYECCNGDFVGEIVSNVSRNVNPRLMAEMLNAAGSEPGFFQLEDLAGVASELYESSSTEFCPPALMVVTRKAFNSAMEAADMQAYKLFMSIQNSSDNWENDDIQFPRLIEEAQVAGAFTPEILRSMADAMDLEVKDVVCLLERAGRKWDAIKAET